MSDSHDGEITHLLSAMDEGQQSADELLPLVYRQLRALARSRMAGEAHMLTLEPTALVHEAFLRVRAEGHGFRSRNHFFSAAALAMRRILVDQARRRARVRHGGDQQRVQMHDAVPQIAAPDEEILAVHEALAELEAADARKGDIVNLRYFVGMSNRETAETLSVSVGTVEREWRFIKAWLQQRLGAQPPS